MRKKINELTCGRYATCKEEEFLLNYFMKENAIHKKILIIFVGILWLVCTLVIIGKVSYAVESRGLTFGDIIIFFVFICIVIVSIYQLQKMKNDGIYVNMIKTKQYMLSDVICKKARFFLDTSDRKYKYECTLQLVNGLVLTKKYYICISEIKNYDALKRNSLMSNRPMLICAFLSKNYIKLFDKANVDAY